MPIRSIEALDPAHRHAHTPANLTPNHQFYEWWYFEVEFVDNFGKPWRVITSFHYPHGMDSHRVLAHQRYRNRKVDFFAKYGDDPGHYAGIASYVVDIQDSKNVGLLISRVPRAEIGSRVAVSRPGDPKVEVRIGDSSFVQNPNGTFTLTVKQKGMAIVGATPRALDLDMQVTFEQNTPGFQPPGAVLIEQTGVRHHWACVMPNPKVTIDHIVLQRARLHNKWRVLCRAKRDVVGEGGYHDHQWGDDLIYKQIAQWYWGRLPTGARGDARPRDKVLFFDVVGVSRPGHPAVRPDPVLVQVPGDGSAAAKLMPTPDRDPFHISGSESINFGDGCRIGVQGQNVPYPRWIYIRAQTAGGQSRDFNVEHLRSSNVDTWPFYVRFVPRVYDYHSGKIFDAISEVMRADRIPLDGAQKVNALADKITVGA